ncbi:phytanoyl-CoA dioxygenase family protein [Paenibacillus sp. OV219]|uniref:phytanoyl-CoA dioxygenase family protein n=1 Tax=Paenibacillus sp. OV219 TaxID=1884377 RepID=UPI0008CCBF4D|nr:phytanoyl-CoA dioxygenase family protein [Paenibacillus sp. OV219]SEO76860.1 Ectoine hydroxylase-related dioxygenase, phytanoyl-CoA dioxygenase (PhyH) family [Paenibacillus sp. OV219]
MIISKMQISEDKVRFYRENGFVQIDNVLSPEELEELRQHMDETMNAQGGRGVQTSEAGGAYFKVLNQRVNTWRDHGGMARFVLGERFADLGKQLTGFDGIRLFHDHALLKMPGDSKVTPWHQDRPYWPIEGDKPMIAFSIWVALDDVDEHNGCMMFVPKSQKIRNLKGVDLVTPEDIFEQEGAKELDRNTAVICRMKAGSCTFHDGMTFHFAHANSTDKPRRALAIIFLEDGTRYSGAGHIITDGLGFEPGDQLGGGLLPKLA